MGFRRKFLSIIMLHTFIENMIYASSDIVSKKYVGDFCFNYGKTDQHGCIYDTDSVECTLVAAMVGPALNSIRNVNIKVIHICVDNSFTGNLSADAGKQPVIDITALRRFPGLLKFVITIYPRVIRDLYRLHYNSSTFEHMNQLKTFLLNLPLHTGNTTSMQLLDL